MKNDNFAINDNQDENIPLRDREGSMNFEIESDSSKQEWRNLKALPDSIDFLNVVFVIGIFMATMIVSIGLGLILNYQSNMSILLIIFGLFMGGTYVYGIYSLRWMKELSYYYVESKQTSPEEINYSNEYTYLSIYNFLLMLFFIVSLFSSMICFGLQDYYLHSIEKTSMNDETWQSLYKNQSYDLIYAREQTLLIIGGIFGIFLAIYGLISSILTLRLFDLYRAFQIINEFVCFLIFVFGCILLTYGIRLVKNKEILKVNDSLPYWFANYLIFSSLCSIAISIVGFVGSLNQDKLLIQIFSYLSIISAVITLTIAISSSMYGEDFKNNYECKDYLGFLGRYVVQENLSCEKKYEFITNNLTNIKCPKERVVLAWEQNIELDVNSQTDYYGCLDEACCSSVLHLVKRAINLISLYAYFLFALNTIVTIGAIYMDSRLSQTTRFGVFNIIIKWILIIVAILIGIFLLVIVGLQNSVYLDKSRTVAFNESSVQGVSNISIIPFNSLNLIPRKIFLRRFQNSTTFKEDKSLCKDNCLSTKYYFELSSNDGIFTINNTLFNNSALEIVKNNSQNNGWIIGFYGDESKLNNFTNYVDFENNCPLLPASIQVIIDVTAGPSKGATAAGAVVPVVAGNLNTLQIKNEQNADISTKSILPGIHIVNVTNLSLGQTVNLLNNTVDHSFASNSTQVFTGRVVKRENPRDVIPVAWTEVRVTANDFPQCLSKSYSAQLNGVFTTDKIFVLNSDTPVMYNFQFKSVYETFPEINITVLSGGPGHENIVNFGDITFYSGIVTDEKYYFNTTILNSINNLPISNANVSLYIGNLYLDNTNPLAQNYNTTINPLFNATTSDINGTIHFNSLPANKYTMVFQKDNFYREIIQIEVIGALTKPINSIKMTQLVKNNQIRFVLDWPNKPSDLNLHSFFSVSNTVKCRVFFGYPNCNEVTLDSSNEVEGQFRGSSITINKLGNYIYTFAVNKYIDILSPNKNLKTFMDTSLADSQAKILVYSYGYIQSIAKLEISKSPEASNSNSMNWWLAYCLDGSLGLEYLKPVNKLMLNEPGTTFCEKWFENEKRLQNYNR